MKELLRRRSSPLRRLPRFGAPLLLGLTVLPGVTLLGVTLRTTTASACDCSVESEAFPRSTDGVLPQDTRVWIPNLLAEMRAREQNLPVTQEGISPTTESVATLFALNDSNGNAVAFSVTPIVDGDDQDVYFMLTPNEPLAPGEYQVVGTSTSFSIGAEPTATPPAPPEIESQHSSSESGVGNSCGESRAEHFQIVPRAPLLLTAVNLQPQAEGENWRASALTSSNFVSVGQTGCGTIDWNFDDGPVDVRFAALNFSGQISTWTEPQRVFVEEGCGCAVVGRPSEARRSTLWTYLVLGLVFGVRTRARRRRSGHVNTDQG